jgi:hypothetical protein
MRHRCLAAGLVASMAMSLAASHAVAQEPQQREVVFAKMPGRYKAYGSPGPYFPERAERLNVNGYGVIECRVMAQGVLNACASVSETPDGFDFAAAALRMASVRAITTTGEPTAGTETIRLAVPFQLRYRGERLGPPPPY